MAPLPTAPDMASSSAVRTWHCAKDQARLGEGRASMIRLPALLLVLLAMIAGAAPCAVQTDPGTGRPLGPEHRFEGVYVTNFEIGYVYECEAALGACDDWQKIESRWLVGGTPDVERQLMDCAARWNGSRD